MQSSFEVFGNTLIVRVTGEIDHYSAQELREKIDIKVAGEQVKNLIFDFSGLAFMDSSGIGVIMGRYRNLCAMGGKVAIVCPNRIIAKLINLSGISGIIKMYDSLDTAVSGM